MGSSDCKDYIYGIIILVTSSLSTIFNIVFMIVCPWNDVNKAIMALSVIGLILLTLSLGLTIVFICLLKSLFQGEGNTIYKIEKILLICLSIFYFLLFVFNMVVAILTPKKLHKSTSKDGSNGGNKYIIVSSGTYGFSLFCAIFIIIISVLDFVLCILYIRKLKSWFGEGGSEGNSGRNSEENYDYSPRNQRRYRRNNSDNSGRSNNGTINQYIVGPKGLKSKINSKDKYDRGSEDDDRPKQYGSKNYSGNNRIRRSPGNPNDLRNPNYLNIKKIRPNNNDTENRSIEDEEGSVNENEQRRPRRGDIEYNRHLPDRFVFGGMRVEAVDH